ncbi:hypothetical protein BD410DRAFT_899621 [Rickenella mellea]|uniref:Uncharacterized protein n=1 Tax=Rickenella mellea TaxID=50990 RepID=A0A4Y7Q0D9_9AGAM|nr:hypothetical protein BD410DRAFT_899621 [Rickenella mellea]
MPPKPKGAKAPVKKPTTQNPASKPSKSTTRTKDAEKNKPEPSMAAEIETDTELTELTSDTDANAAPPVTIAQRPVTRAKNANQRPGKILEQFSRENIARVAELQDRLATEDIAGPPHNGFTLASIYGHTPVKVSFGTPSVASSYALSRSSSAHTNVSTEFELDFSEESQVLVRKKSSIIKIERTH